MISDIPAEDGEIDNLFLQCREFLIFPNISCLTLSGNFWVNEGNFPRSSRVVNLPLSLLGNFPKFVTEGIFSFTFAADKKKLGKIFFGS